MENLGALAVLLAFCLTIYAVVGSVVGKWKRNPFLTLSAERAVYAVWFLVTSAAGLLIYALLTDDYRWYYVAGHTNRTMPAVYKFAAWWGGQEGSLLLWSWVLSTYSAVVVFQNRRKYRDMMPYVVATLMATQCFFLILNTFVVSPFQVLVQGGKTPFAVPDGQGLNPTLQRWMMAIHPPILYCGYVGFIVPFAFAMGSLITKQKGDAWIHTTRRWTLVTWLFQTTGITLGAGWAYEALGWGGYWAWDPVENASFLPWLTATAFLHSVMMQEKKGMMKIWNMALISCTFLLCIFGTFLTRSGVVSSVHAFAQSSIGSYFLVFIGITAALVIWGILSRLEYLKSETPLESVLSRESSFLFNNLILLASCFAILWGTLFPVISEAVTGEKISVGKPFFDRVNVPIGLFLLFLTGVGPLIAWRKSSFESLRRAFFWPTIAAVAVAVVLAIGGMRHAYAMLALSLCAFVTVSIGMEFYKGAKTIAAKSGMSLFPAMAELSHRNTRRYGGYLVHMGIVAMFIGFSGSAFNKDTTVEVTNGDTVKLGAYEIKVKTVTSGQNEQYIYKRALVEVNSGGKLIGTYLPERRLYRSTNGQEQPTSEVSIRRRLHEDLYMNFAGDSPNADKTVMQVFIFPLVQWVWIGFGIVLFGTSVCLVPSKVKLVYPRTEVVGVKPAYAAIEK